MTTLTDETPTRTDTVTEHAPSIEETVRGLAATMRHTLDQRDTARDRFAGARTVIRRQADLIAGLAHWVVDAEAQRDAALKTAVREHAENLRLRGRIREQADRIGALQRASERRDRPYAPLLRESVADPVLARIEEALTGPCACLPAPAATDAADAPVAREESALCEKPGCGLCGRPASSPGRRGGLWRDRFILRWPR